MKSNYRDAHTSAASVQKYFVLVLRARNAPHVPLNYENAQSDGHIWGSNMPGVNVAQIDNV